MTSVYTLVTVLLLAPSAVIAAFWWGARRRHARLDDMPDAEALILARVGGVLCGVLPVVQLLASMVRYKTGEPGLYLWYLVPLCGVVFTIMVLAGFLTHARGRERTVSSAMLLLSLSALLLVTFVASEPGA